MRPPYLQLPSGLGSGEIREPQRDGSNYGQCTEDDALHGAAPGTAPARHCETSRPLGTTHGEGGHPGTWAEESRSYVMKELKFKDMAVASLFVEMSNSG